jgi:hypothetical protein
LALRPFDPSTGSGLRASGEKYNEIKPETARAEPFDFAQDMPFDFAQDMPFDFAQDMLVEVPFASGMSISDRHWR